MPPNRVIVSDSSPLIALKQIDRLLLLRELFESIVIPPRVQVEIKPAIPNLPSWIEVRACSQPMPFSVTVARLDAGESEGLSLALEIAASLVLMDEKLGRRHARSLGFDVLGTFGLLTLAKTHGLLPTVKPDVERLMNEFSFRVSPSLLQMTLSQNGEE